MGILDDAIREHLELKRKHGVPAEEVERQEEEALGPARREVAPTQPQDAADADETAVDEPVAEAPDEAAEEPQAALEPEPEPEHEEPEPEPEAPPQPEPEPEPAAVALSRLEERPVPAGDTPPRGVEAVDEEHQEHEERGEQEEHEEHEDGDDPDVLQDTPDFLQETPEHDRLWFEQKPPRDFDFD